MGIHVLEPVAKVVTTRRVVPKPNFDKKKLKGLAQSGEYKKAKKERLKKL